MIRDLKAKNEELLKINLKQNKYISQLESNMLVSQTSNNGSVDHLLIKADAAMKQYTERLKKEGAKYAKQKQSKRQ